MRKVPIVDVSALTKIAASDLRLLWVNDWYDGPLEAIVEHAGVSCLMVLQHESDDDYTWLLVRLTPEQRVDEEKWHALFATHVGDHWCFHGEAVVHPPPPSGSRPDGFFGAYKTRPPVDLSRNAVVGWADEMPAK